MPKRSVDSKRLSGKDSGTKNDATAKFGLAVGRRLSVNSGAAQVTSAREPRCQCVNLDLMDAKAPRIRLSAEPASSRAAEAKFEA